jgi:hypothetical protein
MALSLTSDAIRKRKAAMPKMIKQAAMMIRKRDADAIILNFRSGIATKSFRLAPLKRATIKRKRQMGYPAPGTPLYSSGHYMVSLRKYQTKRGYVVKFPNRALPCGLTEAQLMEVHEYGAVIPKPNGGAFRIPPRPAFLYAYQKTLGEMTDRSADVMAVAKEYIKDGRSATFSRIRANARKLEVMNGESD